MAEQGLHEDLAGKLLAWYDAHARELPWREKRGIAPDPYRVWLSEIMLQQTTVFAVRGYYIKFLLLWPTVSDLAKASQDDDLADEMAPSLAALGFTASIHPNPEPERGPLLIASRHEADDLPTVLIYGHGDVIRGAQH